MWRSVLSKRKKEREEKKEVTAMYAMWVRCAKKVPCQ
jgi:hypothetical protein